MKKNFKCVATVVCAAVVLSSCAVYDYPVYTSASVGVGGAGWSTSVSWTNASYDQNGFPIYGYYYGQPVYGYTPAGVAVFSIAALTAACMVPDWSPAPWYCGHWHYPAHVHRVAVPRHCPAGHHPGVRPPHHSHHTHHASHIKPNHKPGINHRPGVNHKPAINHRPGVNHKPDINHPPGVNHKPDINHRPGVNHKPAINHRPGVNHKPSINNRPSVNHRPAMSHRPSVSHQSRPQPQRSAAPSRPQMNRGSMGGGRSHGGGGRSHGGGHRGHRR